MKKTSMAAIVFAFGALLGGVAEAAPSADLNLDGKVTCADLYIVRDSFGKRIGQTGYKPVADINTDGVIDIRDLAYVARQLPIGSRC